MNIRTLKRSLISVYKNIPGKSLGRKIIVFEADDYGSIRMPSAAVHRTLLNAGLPVNDSRYEQHDTLEDSDDLNSLFSVLENHRGVNGEHPVISPFCNTANPDFEKIKEDSFTTYHHEPFTITYKRYGRSADIMQVWDQGIKADLISPEYHGREHLSTDLWLCSLRSGDKKLRLAFDHGLVSYSPTKIPAIAKGFRPNFYISRAEALAELKTSLEQGIDIFKQEFGFCPVVFNAPNGVFIPEFNESLMRKGIRYNAVPRRRFDRDLHGSYSYKTFSTGQKSVEGLSYYVRNCNFEPTEKGYQGIGHVMSQIQGAFICGKAAIIGTHRVNFAGGMNQSNRKKGLDELDALLKAVLKRWPDVQFMSSRQLTSLL